MDAYEFFLDGKYIDSNAPVAVGMGSQLVFQNVVSLCPIGMSKRNIAFKRMSLMDTWYALARLIPFVFVLSGEICEHIAEIRIPVGFLEPFEITFKP